MLFTIWSGEGNRFANGWHTCRCWMNTHNTVQLGLGDSSCERGGKALGKRWQGKTGICQHTVNSCVWEPALGTFCNSDSVLSTTATICVSPPFSCVWRLLPSSWFSSAFSVLRSLNSVLYLGFFLFPGFLSLVLGLLEQLPFAFSSAWALPPLFFCCLSGPCWGP